MSRPLDPITLSRLDTQGFDGVPAHELAEVAPWHRLAFFGCAGLAALATVLASPELLVVLALIAAGAAAFPVHPFDLIYNLGIRHLRGTGPLPRRGVPGRAACGMGALVLLGAAWLFASGYTVAGYFASGHLALIAGLVATTDICIPSILYRRVFGPPAPREAAG